MVDLDAAVATSGIYERGRHILDPHSGLPARGLLSATVTGPDLALSDALATGLFAAGERGLGSIAALEDYDAFVLGEDGTVLATPGFEFHPPLTTGQRSVGRELLGDPGPRATREV